MNSLPSSTLKAMLDKLRMSGNVMRLGSVGVRYESSVEDGKPDRTSYETLRSAIVTLLANNLMLTTDAAPTVYIGAFVDESTNRPVVHLANYDYTWSSESDNVKSTGPIKLRLRLPPHTAADKLVLQTPDRNVTPR